MQTCSGKVRPIRVYGSLGRVSIAVPMTANGMVRPCSCPASDKLARGALTRSTQCPQQQHRMRSP